MTSSSRVAGRAAEILQSALERGEVRDDERRRELAAIAEEDGLRDERAALEDRLDRLRRDLLAAEVTSRSFLRSVIVR